MFAANLVEEDGDCNCDSRQGRIAFAAVEQGSPRRERRGSVRGSDLGSVVARKNGFWVKKWTRERQVNSENLVVLTKGKKKKKHQSF